MSQRLKNTVDCILGMFSGSINRNGSDLYSGQPDTLSVTHPSQPTPFYYHRLSLLSLFSVSFFFFFKFTSWYSNLECSVYSFMIWKYNDRFLIRSTHLDVLWVFSEITKGRLCRINWREWSLVGMEFGCWEAEERSTWDPALQGPCGERTPAAL